ncbi:MAG TPA: ABC transporter permease [Planctomycetota bacterium]|nr:ABC transporter permease [Planctomycetota bacterium]
MSRVERVLLPLGVAALVIAVWSVWAKGGNGGATDFPTPLEVWRGYGILFRPAPGEHAPLILKHVVASLFRTMTAFIAAVAVGVPFGLILGWSSRWSAAVNWLVQMVRPISPIAWIPIAIMVFHGDDLRAVFLIFIAASLPLVVSTAAAVHAVPSMYIRAARNFGAGDVEILQKVVVPASLPQILLAMRVTMGISWLVIVAAEMVAVQDGLGWLITDARYQGARTDLIVGTMIVIGLIGWGIDSLLRRFERHPRVSWGYPRNG